MPRVCPQEIAGITKGFLRVQWSLKVLIRPDFLRWSTWISHDFWGVRWISMYIYIYLYYIYIYKETKNVCHQQFLVAWRSHRPTIVDCQMNFMEITAYTTPEIWQIAIFERKFLFFPDHLFLLYPFVKHVPGCTWGSFLVCDFFTFCHGTHQLLGGSSQLGSS